MFVSLADVEAVSPGYIHVTIITETSQYNISSMATLATHIPLRLHVGDMSVCVWERQRSKRAEVLIDLFFRLFR